MKRQQVRYVLLFISFLLFPVTIYYFSPALIIMGAAEGVIVGSFVVFATQFLGSLIFGRAWCGWLCPAGGLQEACQRVNDRQVGGRRWIKYLIWLPWAAGIAIAAWSAGGFRAVKMLYSIDGGISIMQPGALFVYYSFVGLIVILALTAGRRAFCHYVCWMSPFMAAGAKIRDLAGWPALRLAADPERCSGCGRCAKACPMSLDVPGLVKGARMRHPDCILCGECVDTCPRAALRYDVRPLWSTQSARSIDTGR